ncbi:MAG: AAA family ATPase [Sandaracinaceae bacterium]|nr:AAA family ATPase [Sandaracinaceae bacterium]
MSFAEAERHLRAALAQRERALLVIAGPNGAGKSTFYDTVLAALGLPFVNADLIAATLAEGDPVRLARRASSVADEERAALLARGESFVTETVFSDPAGAKIAMLREAQDRGYAVLLVFVGVASAGLGVLRVGQRVAAGGHPVPLARIEARFPRTLANLRTALGFVDVAWIFDNSSVEVPFRFVARWERGRRVRRSRLRPAWLPDDLR